MIIVAGLLCSGSTWLFNACRLLSNLPGFWIDDWNGSLDCVVKIHYWNEPLSQKAEHILTSHRNLKEVQQSINRRGWSEDKLLLKHLDSYIKWNKISDYNMDYAIMMHSSKIALREIAESINVKNYNEDFILNYLKTMKYNPKNSKGKHYDSINLMHLNHRGESK